MKQHDNAFTPPTSLRWLFFDLNSYFASVEQQDRPCLRGKPIAVVPSMTDATCAIAASYEAKAYGIKTGTRIYEAKRLCPQLICVQARHDLYTDYHHKIMAEVCHHIPITTICSIDEAACRLMNNEQTPKAALSIAQKIKAGLFEHIGTEIRCSIGIAPNMFLAKSATDMQKPNGLVILQPGNYQKSLFELPLEALHGIGPKMHKRLLRAGIYTTEQLWHLHPKHVRQIWGSVAGEIFWYKLHGYDFPSRATQKRMVGQSRVLAPQERNPEQAFFIAQNLTDKACQRLRRYGLFAGKLALKVDAERSQKGGNSSRNDEASPQFWSKESSFIESNDTLFITRRLQALWGSLKKAFQGRRLLKVSINLYDLKEKKDLTFDLFEKCNNPEPQAMSTPKLSRAIDLINERFGDNKLYFGSSLQFDYRLKTNTRHPGSKITSARIPDGKKFQDDQKRKQPGAIPDVSSSEDCAC